uniref:Claspin n=1 Tax=Sipha flava TaxID=143950 RepID=A0A2S2QI87_9HEMI
MKSSKSSKTNVDDISRETQRLISSSHVRLPYHKPKQKSLKDFLNKRKIAKEYQASITGSKKLLEKAWEFIEAKEQNVEKFYNEDCSEDEDNEELPTNNDDVEAKNNVSLNSNNENGSNKGFSDDEENDDNNSVINNDLSANDVMCSFNDDEEEDFRSISSCSNKSLTEQEKSKNIEFISNHNDIEDMDSEDELTVNVARQFIDDLAELSESDNSSEDDENVPDLIDDSDEDVNEFSKKRVRRLVLSESSDDDSNLEIKLTTDDLMPLLKDPEETNVCTQQLMGLCSGQFQTQKSEEQEDNENIEDDFDSEVPQNDADDIINEDYEDELPKLISAKDYFDEEAELSESDWSSDDEEHILGAIDKLEEEEGDKDKLDEDVVKDGLDKIYMRQLLDDDQQQVSALKEMLLEDGELHTDSGRKRKFQWEDQDDAAFKKPLFSEDEDEYEDDAMSDDDKAEQWRKERFKRESYLSQKNNSDDEQIIENEGSESILQSSVSVVTKTHVVKYQKKQNKKICDTISLENTEESLQLNDKNSITSIIVENDTIETPKISSNTIIDFQVANVIASKPNKLVKGSFMKRNNEKKMTNTLLYMNKKSIIDIDENNSRKYKDNSEIKPINTITGTANNPFAYLLRTDKNQEHEKKDISNRVTNVEKKENICSTISSANVQSSQQLQISNHKSVKSILKQLE